MRQPRPPLIARLWRRSRPAAPDPAPPTEGTTTPAVGTAAAVLPQAAAATSTEAGPRHSVVPAPSAAVRALARPGVTLTLRSPEPALLALPWAQPLDRWAAPTVTFVDLPVGPSRHLVRFVRAGGLLLGVKEMSAALVQREFAVLRRLEADGMPAVRPLGTALRGAPDDADADGLLVTEYLRGSIQYRRLLLRTGGVASPLVGRLLDAMAFLLADLHRNGVWWGDCSLENTLLRRDGGRIQAFLVDAETSELHAPLSDGQRRHDLELLIENVAYGLADVASALDGNGAAVEAGIRAARSVRPRYDRLWDELARPLRALAGDRLAVRARIRRLNELGFAVSEVAVQPGGLGLVDVRLVVAGKRFHAEELRRRTGVEALEGQAQILLNDLGEYGAWLAGAEGRVPAPEAAAARWRADVLEPTLQRLAPALAPGRDPLQAYCDLLEHKWLLSERAGHDVGLEAALNAYLDAGAPAPETAPPAGTEATREADEDLLAAAVADADAAADAGEPADRPPFPPTPRTDA